MSSSILIADAGRRERIKEMGDKRIEGYIDFTDVKLIDIKTGEVIWEGELKERLKDTSEEFLLPSHAANMALQNVLNNFTAVLESTLSTR